MIERVRSIGWIGLGVLAGTLILAVRRPAQALPEYAARTGQPCATCHVNPAGGGPRTLRGLLWVAQGKPDQVPPLPGSQEQPAMTTDGAALFEKFACSGCHGTGGEGGIGPALNHTELSPEEIAQIVRNGRGGMMAFQTQVLPDADLEMIIQYIQALVRGEAEMGATQQKAPLLPAQIACQAGVFPFTQPSGCGGN